MDHPNGIRWVHVRNVLKEKLSVLGVSEGEDLALLPKYPHRGQYQYETKPSLHRRRTWQFHKLESHQFKTREHPSPISYGKSLQKGSKQYKWGHLMAPNIRNLEPHTQIYCSWTLKWDHKQFQLLFEQLWPEAPGHAPRELICEGPPPIGASSQN